jgi:hypothetical protein
LIFSLTLFGNDIQSRRSWYTYLGAILAFLLAVYALAPPGQWLPRFRFSAWGRSRRWFEGVALALILLVGAFYRLYRFTELPYGLWYDEADNGLATRQILADPDSWPIYAPATNLPTHFLYLIALSFRLLGDSMYAIRAVAVVFGMLTILAAYFCGRELFYTAQGQYFGLILAFLIAVARWDVNWSRIGMHGVTVPFFELWVVGALLRGLRTGRLIPFAWAGIALGLGLCFYSPFRIFPVAVVGFVLAWLWRWLERTGRLRPRRPGSGQIQTGLAVWGLPALLLIAGTLLAVAPVAQFAIRRPELFWDRAKRISVFKDPDVQARPVAAIAQSAAKHLLMFNFRGDPNGRHNLPGAPMLDRTSGVLLVLGTVICVLYWRDPRSVLLLLWLLIPLSGGIFSTWFEAPQSLRSIGSLPAACATICLPMEWFSAEWTRSFPKTRAFSHRSPWATPLGGVLVLALLAIGLDNGVTYFGLWAHDFASWAAFNPAETHMAQDIQLYRHDHDLRFDPLLTAHLATRYLLPDYPVYHHFDPATAFPIRGTDKAGVLLFIAPDTRAVRAQAWELYPNVQVETFAHDHSGIAILHKFRFTRDEIAAKQGLDAHYVSLGTENAEISRRVDAEIDHDWGRDPPQAYPFQATWRGGLFAPEYGPYRLQVDVPGECALLLDEQVVVAGPGSQGREIVMAQGVHALLLDCRVSQAGRVRLMWATPADEALRPVPRDTLYRSFWPVRGLLGRFYPNADWSGEPQIARIDRQVAHYFHFLPLSRPYTVEWTGRLAAPVSGAYRLGVKAISSASLYVDDQPLVEDTLPGEFADREIYMDAGLHDVRVRYLDNQSHSQIYLSWQLPGTDPQPIPFDALFLPAEGAWWPMPSRASGH